MYQLCMSKSDTPYIPFSQRNGLVPIPPQLKLGEVSNDLRRVINYFISLEIDCETSYVMGSRIFKPSWKRVTQDIFVLFFGHPIGKYKASVDDWRTSIASLTETLDLPKLFDFVEFLSRHDHCSADLKKNLANAFISERAAYRVIDGQIVAIGTNEQADAFDAAIKLSEDNGALAARAHLVTSGACLRNGDWSGSIRESIHSVEAIAVRLSNGASTLGAALAALEKRGYLHGSLKGAFGQLYGYSSNEEGVRHALVFKDEPQVDETDALFMLGACASFVSYLLARSASIGAKPD